MNTQSPTPAAATTPADPHSDMEDLPWTGITVVIAVLGLLFFMAVPMGGASPTQRLAAQRARLAFVAQGQFQHAVEDYRGDHGFWPGREAASSKTVGEPSYGVLPLHRQLQLMSDGDGATLPTQEGEFTFGPYLPNGVPTNPQNGLKSVRLLEPGESFDRILDGVYGWVYDPRSGEVQPHVLPFQRASLTRKTTPHGRFRN